YAPTRQLMNGTTTFDIYFRTAKSSHNVTASGSYTAFIADKVGVKYTSPAALQMVFPGETAVPGSGTGLHGLPDLNGDNSDGVESFIAGTPIPVEVRLVDQFFNVVSAGVMPQVEVVNDDSNSNSLEESPASLTGGTRTFNVTIRTANSVLDGVADHWGVTVQEQPVTFGYTSSTRAITLQSDTAQNLLIFAPGQTFAPGSTTGKGGVIGSLTAGTAYNLTVRAVDQYNNRDLDATHNVTLDTTDPWDNENIPAPFTSIGLFQGGGVFPNWRPLTAMSPMDITVSTAAGGYLTPQTVSIPQVKADTTTVKLQLLIPGETAVPGSSTGKATVLGSFTAGSEFTVTVRTVDNNWNVVTTTHPWVKINTFWNSDFSPSDANYNWDGSALYSANYGVGLTSVPIGGSGEATFGVTLKYAGGANSHHLTAGADALPGVTSDSPNFTVVPAALSGLQIVVPGETVAPGKESGQVGKREASLPTAWTAGSPANVTVNAVDPYWNKVSASSTVYLMTGYDLVLNPAGDPNLTAKVSTQTLVGGTTVFPAVMVTRASGKTIAVMDQLPSAEPSGIANYTQGVTGNSLPFSVNANVSKRLHVVLPGQTLAEGKPPYGGAGGRNSSPSDIAAGQNYSVTVYLTDFYYNRKTTSSVAGQTTLRVTTTDPNDGNDPDVTQSIPIGSDNTNFMHVFQTAGNWTLTAQDVTGDGSSHSDSVSSAFNVIAATYPAGTQKFLLVMPGETHLPGTVVGKTGAMEDFIAGMPRNVTILGVDQYSNIIQDNPGVQLNTNDGFAAFGTLTPPVSLGSATTNVTFKAARVTSTQLGATQNGSGTTYPGVNYTAVSISTITVKPATANRLLVLAPGETAVPGSSYGRQGYPDADYNNSADGDPLVDPGLIDKFIAGTQYNFNVKATDDYYNLVSTASASIKFETDDPFDALPAEQNLTGGATIFAHTFVSASPSGWTVTVSTGAGSTNLYTSTTSAKIVVRGAPSSKLQVLLPGETAVPGSSTGKAGSPDANGDNADGIQSLVAGTTIQVTVKGVDTNFNVDAAALASVHMITADPWDDEPPANLPLVNGTTVFSVLFVTTGAHTVTVSDQDGTALDSTSSAAMPVVAGAANRLLVVLPGETHAPGRPPYEAGGMDALPTANPVGGRVGTAANYNWTAGISTTVRVMATDKYWNLASDSRQVKLTPGDNSPLISIATQSLVGGSTAFSVALYTAHVATGTAYDFLAFDDSLVKFTPAVYRTTNVLVLPDTGNTRMRVLADDLQRAAGTTSGVSGSVSDKTAGIPFSVTVDVTDQYGNMVNFAPTVRVTAADDAFAPNLPRNVPLTGGTSSFMVTLVTERTDDSGPPNEATTPSSSRLQVYNITYGSVTVNVEVDDDQSKRRLLLLLPGETAVPGSLAAGGKIGTPSTFSAGQNINVTIRAVDDYFNRVENNNPNVTLTSNDPFAAMPLINGQLMSNGQYTQDIFLQTANTAPGWVLTSTSTDPEYHVPDTASPVPIQAANLEKLQVILPGETAVPGSTTGKVGTRSVQRANEPFYVQVRAVDPFHNVISTINTDTVRVTTKDPFDADPGVFSLSGGQVAAPGVPVTLFVATDTIAGGFQEIYARGESLNIGTSTCTALAVNPSTNTNQIQLQVLVPGETAVPGSSAGLPSAGQIGSAASKDVGDTFTVMVRFTDSKFNKIRQGMGLALPQIVASSDDPFDLEPIAANLDASGTRTFNFSFQKENLAPGWRIYVSTYSGSPITVPSDLSSYIVTYSTTADRLQLLLPGETAVPGSGPNATYPDARGRAGVPDKDGDNGLDGDAETGNIDRFVAGVPATVTVRVTDRFYNLKPLAAPLVKIQTSDPFDAHPGNKTLTGGATTFVVTFLTNTLEPNATSWWVMASTASGVNYATDTVTGVSVTAAPPTRLQVLVPGETAVPGSSTGKTGEPDYVPGGAKDYFVAGMIFPVTVRLVDDNFNREVALGNYSATPKLSADDDYDTIDLASYTVLGAGLYQFAYATLNTRNEPGDNMPDVPRDLGWRITATDIQAIPYAAGVSTYVPVRAGDAAKLMVYVRGEQHVEGNLAGGGRSGSPDAEMAGSTFPVTALVTDVAFNRVTSDNGTSITLTCDDAFATLPGAQTVVQGSTTFNVW
ncbi:MAG TPA: hypothetical protein P5079_08370, partial [Elusimicrobiota bacterium]|nr:hypothetical protein [Elusimicrobiota bacterium]